MPPLSRELRKKLENTVREARRVAEQGAAKVLNALAVGEAKAAALTPDQQELRRRLRAHGRQLGDRRNERDTQETNRLCSEIAYEHWHRMLFARFLAENDLLIEPGGAPVSIEDCRE